MKFINLASSSSGNCYWVELERSNLPPVKLLLEAGIPYKEIVTKTVNNGLSLSELSGVIITHSHGDHYRAVPDLIRRGFKVYGNQHVCGNPNYLMESQQTKVIAANTKVIPFEVMHDAPNPLGYIICTDKEKLLFIADCKYWEYDLSMIAFDYVIIEANYDGRTIHFALEEAKKNMDASNEHRYKRIVNAHMSIDNCCKALQKLNLTQCKAIFLIHLSDRHANENLFKKKATDATHKQVFVCKKNGGIL